MSNFIETFNLNLKKKKRKKERKFTNCLKIHAKKFQEKAEIVEISNHCVNNNNKKKKNTLRLMKVCVDVIVHQFYNFYFFLDKFMHKRKKFYILKME